MKEHVLKGKVAVVTGSSKGIGAAIAKEFAMAGASVTVNFSTDEVGARRTVSEITANGGKAISVRANVGIRVEVQQLFAETIKAFGRIDVLVNNAGVYSFGSLETFIEEEFERQFHTNVLGTLLASQEALKHFGPEGGSIINIGSGVTQTVVPGMVVYTASKGAVDSITHVLAKELGARRIRVNSINPGGTETEGVHALGIIGTDMEKQMVAQTPLGRLGQPTDIALIAVFLASDASGWLTGEILIASGGVR